MRSRGGSCEPPRARGADDGRGAHRRGPVVRDVAGLERNADVRILRGVPAGTPGRSSRTASAFPTNDPAVRRALAARDQQGRDRARRLPRPEPGRRGSLIQPRRPGFVPRGQGALPVRPPARAKKDPPTTPAGQPAADGIRVKEGLGEILWHLRHQQRLRRKWPPGSRGWPATFGIDIRLPSSRAWRCTRACARARSNGIGELNWWFPDPSISTTNFHTSRLQAFNPSATVRPEIDKLLARRPDGGGGAAHELYKEDSSGCW